MAPPPSVTVTPSGVSFEVAADETVMVAAARAGLRWPTVCGGNASCGVCMSVVTEGEQHCSPIGTDEKETLERVARIVSAGPQRLACRLTVDGDVRLARRGVRPSAPSSSLPPESNNHA